MAPRDEAQIVQVGLRVKESLRARLEEAARCRGTSMNAETVRRLERSLEQDEIDLDAVRSSVFELLDAVSNLQRDLIQGLATINETVNKSLGTVRPRSAFRLASAGETRRHEGQDK